MCCINLVCNCFFLIVRQFLSCGGSYPPASVARNVLSNKLYRPRIVTLQFGMISSSVHISNIVTLRNSFIYCISYKLISLSLVMTQIQNHRGRYNAAVLFSWKVDLRCLLFHYSISIIIIIITTLIIIIIIIDSR